MIKGLYETHLFVESFLKSNLSIASDDHSKSVINPLIKLFTHKI